MKHHVTFSDLFMSGMQIAFRNWLPILGALVLIVLTFWIPYLNLGTFVAFFMLPLFISNKKGLNPMDVFKPEHRASFTSMLLLTFILGGGIYIALTVGTIAASVFGSLMLYTGIAEALGFNPLAIALADMNSLMLTLNNPNLRFSAAVIVICFSIIMMTPYIVLYLKWFMADLLVLDKKMTVLDALKESEKMMDGNKAALFLALVALILITIIAGGIIMWVLGRIYAPWWIGGLALLAIWNTGAAFMLSTKSHLYGKISK